MRRSIKRRDFVVLAAGATAAAAGGGVWTGSARAPEKIRLAALLGTLPLSDPVLRARVAALKTRLSELGWIEGGNFRFEMRSSNGDAVARRVLAKELVAMKPDVLIAGSSPETAALLQETRTIPIVFSTAADPVGSGFVRSLARPGGNVTGFTNNHPVMSSKWLELLKEIAPRTARVAILFNPQTTANGGSSFLSELQAAGAPLGMEIAAAPVTSVAEIEEIVAEIAARRSIATESITGALGAAVAAIGAGPVDALLVLPDSFMVLHRAAIASLAARHRIPAMYPFQYFVDAGGLMSYEAALEEPARQSASYVDLILRGADPAELPVQTPRKFQLLINVGTAEQLGLKVPPALRARADRIVE